MACSKKATANTTLNIVREQMLSFLLISEKKVKMSTPTTLTHKRVRSFSWFSKANKGNKEHIDQKGRNKTMLICR